MGDDPLGGALDEVMFPRGGINCRVQVECKYQLRREAPLAACRCWARRASRTSIASLLQVSFKRPHDALKLSVGRSTALITAPCSLSATALLISSSG